MNGKRNQSVQPETQRALPVLTNMDEELFIAANTHEE